MAAETPNRHYPLPDEIAVPPQSGTQAFLLLKQALGAVDNDMKAAFDGLAGKSPNGHHHEIADVEGLSSALSGKIPASQTFSLDDLNDVSGAAEATLAYVLLKTADGWQPASAAAAIGPHHHAISEVDGLVDALAGKQGIDGKGTANGYAGLDETGKVPTSQLPSLTTTATVGAAVAAASGKSVPADSDRFSGVLAGASTVFWTTWAGIKAALKTYFDTIYTTATAVTTQIATATGGNMAGRAYPRRSDGAPLSFQWSGQAGQPTWLWGGADGVNMAVYNPSNFDVNSVGGWTQPTIANQIEVRAQAWRNDAINNIMPTIAAQGGGAVGTYVLARCSQPGVIGAGTAGSGLTTANVLGDGSGTLTGTWRAMGYFQGQAGAGRTTLFLRAA